MHIPVLQKEVIKYLDPKPNENVIDCTIGEAGHTFAILERNGPKGKVLGIDADPAQIENCKLKAEFCDSGMRRKKKAKPSSHIGNLKKRVILVCDNFANLKEIVKRERLKRIAGVLFDLGMSSWHLEESGRGFSFLKRNEPLDMRYNPKGPISAEKIVNYWSFEDLEKILTEFGEERFAERIAREIIKERKFKPIKTVSQLVEIIKKAVPRFYERGRIHPATRTFQALRIAVNDELNNLEKVLPQTINILSKGGRLLIISFHSLEDRIVKNFYRERALVDLEILNKKPIIPSREEIKINPRSRSAKLRAAVKKYIQ